VHKGYENRKRDLREDKELAGIGCGVDELVEQNGDNTNGCTEVDNGDTDKFVANNGDVVGQFREHDNIDGGGDVLEIV